MQASDSLVGKHQAFSRFGGQGLRHQRAAGVVDRARHKGGHPAQIEPERSD